MTAVETNDRMSVTSAAVNGILAREFARWTERAAAGGDTKFAGDFVDWLLRAARDAGASDVHLDPTADGFGLRWRLDGVLQPLGQLRKDVAPNVVARLKVLAGLLTYETALPQEGRIWDERLRVEVRVSTFPTLYGERAVLRLLGATTTSLDSLAQLGLPAEVVGELERHLAATSGAVLVVGPAGSGKTTTAYACLRHIVAHSGGGRSIASLEDPIEVAVEGVAQTQVNLAADFNMAVGLRSLLRLDPEVILIGEMRDRATAETALQAALTGQLVVTTFHAGNSGDAVNRLVEMGIPYYAVHNAVRLVVAQRLVRRLCGCAEPGDADRDARPLGIEVARCRVPVGCAECNATGYRGRALVAEWQSPDGADSASPPVGNERLWKSAESLVSAGATSPMEVVRVLGFRRGA
jgi:type II secretory ATPase GspE/PulE/Tfp pilus assembly ATPase PilB-like protein